MLINVWCGTFFSTESVFSGGLLNHWFNGLLFSSNDNDFDGSTTLNQFRQFGEFFGAHFIWLLGVVVVVLGLAEMNRNKEPNCAIFPTFKAAVIRISMSSCCALVGAIVSLAAFFFRIFLY